MIVRPLSPQSPGECCAGIVSTSPSAGWRTPGHNHNDIQNYSCDVNYPTSKSNRTNSHSNISADPFLPSANAEAASVSPQSTHHKMDDNQVLCGRVPDSLEVSTVNGFFNSCENCSIIPPISWCCDSSPSSVPSGTHGVGQCDNNYHLDSTCNKCNKETFNLCDNCTRIEGCQNVNSFKSEHLLQKEYGINILYNHCINATHKHIDQTFFQCKLCIEHYLIFSSTFHPHQEQYIYPVNLLSQWLFTHRGNTPLCSLYCYNTTSKRKKRIGIFTASFLLNLYIFYVFRYVFIVRETCPSCHIKRGFSLQYTNYHPHSIQLYSSYPHCIQQYSSLLSILLIFLQIILHKTKFSAYNGLVKTTIYYPSEFIHKLTIKTWFIYKLSWKESCLSTCLFTRDIQYPDYTVPSLKLSILASNSRDVQSTQKAERDGRSCDDAWLPTINKDKNLPSETNNTTRICFFLISLLSSFTRCLGSCLSSRLCLVVLLLITLNLWSGLYVTNAQGLSGE